MKNAVRVKGITPMKKFAFSLFVITLLMCSLACIGLADVVEFSLPSKLTEIKAQAFMNDAGISSVIVPEGVETIGAQAFMNCTGLTRIEILGKDTEIASDAFSGVSDLAVVCVPGGKVERFSRNNGYDISYVLNAGDLETPVISSDFSEISVGCSIKWMVQAEGGTEPYKYFYKTYLDGNLIDQSELINNNKYTYETSDAGIYTNQVYVVDAEGHVQSACCDDIVTALNFDIEVNQVINTLYTDSDIVRDYAGEVCINTDADFGTNHVNWEIERVSSEDINSNISLIAIGNYNDVSKASLRFEGIDSYYSAGKITWRISASMVDSDYFFYDHIDFTVDMDVMPEDLPTDITTALPTVLNIGEPLVLNADTVQLIGGFIPEGTSVLYGFNNIDDSYSYIDTFNGDVALYFTENGRYKISVAAYINNTFYEKNIIVCVGDGKRNNYEMALNQQIDVVYTNYFDNNRIGNVVLSGIGIFEEEFADWNIEPVNGNDESHARMYLDDSWADEQNVGINLYIKDIDPEFEGSLTWRVNVSAVNGLYQDSIYCTVIISRDVLEGVPTGATYLNEKICLLSLNTGEKQILENNFIQFTDDGEFPGNPDDAEFWREFWYDIKGDYEEWVDEDGNRCIRFYEDGRYQIEAVIGFNSFMRKAVINVTVGDGIRDPYICSNQRISVVYADSYDQNYIGNAYLEDFDILEGDDVVWSIEPYVNNPIDGAELYADNFFDDMRGVNLHIRNVSAEKAGIYKWTVSVAVNNMHFGSVEFELEVSNSLPENLPTGATFDGSGQTELQLGVGEVQELIYDVIQFTDGSVPDGVEVWREFRVYHNGNGEDWDDEDGKHYVRFDEEGRYQIDAVIGFNSFMRRAIIYVTVGDGVRDPHISKYQRSSVVYTDSYDQNYIGNAYLEDFDILEGDNVVWTIEPDAENPEDGAELYDDNYFDDMRGVNLHIRNISAEKAGSYKWTVSVAVNGQTYGEPVEFELDVSNSLPENLPTGATYYGLALYNYLIMAGDDLILDYNNIQFTEDGNVPEDVEVWREFRYDIKGDYDEWGDKDENRHIRFNEDGRYQIEAVIGFNSFMRRAIINVTVGDGIRDPYICSNQRISVVYADSYDQNYIGSAYLEDFDILDGDVVTWFFVPDAGNPSDGAELYADNFFDDMRGLNLYIKNVSADRVGIYKWTVSVAINSYPLGNTVEFELEVSNSLPENLPTGATFDGLGQTELQLGVGEVQEFIYDVIQFTDGSVPDGVEVWREFWVNHNGNGEDWDDEDGNHCVRFDNEGRYQIEAVIGFNSFMRRAIINVTVGDGIRDPYISNYQRSSVVYADSYDQNYIGNAYLEDFDILEGDNVVWTIEPDAENPEDGAELYDDNYFDDMRGVNLHIRNISADKAGSYKWTVSVKVNNETYGNPVEFVVVVTDVLPDNLPTGATFTKTVYYLAIGDELPLNYNDIQFTDGSVPEDVKVWREFWFDLEGNGEDWDDSVGNRCIRFDKEGRYQIEAVIGFNSFMRRAIINVTVGDGVRDPYISNYQRSSVVYADSYDQSHIGNAYLEDFDIINGDDVVWSIVPGPDNPEDGAELYDDNYFDDMRGVNLHIRNVSAEKAGSYKWTVSVAVNDQSYGEPVEFELKVSDSLPDNLPTGATFNGSGQTELQLDVGEVHTLNYDDIQFTDGSVPDGVEVWREFWVNHNGNGEDWDDEDGNHCVRFDKEGRYQIEAVIGFNSFMRRAVINVTVGDGVRDPYISKYQRNSVVYADSYDQNYIGNAYLEDFDIINGDNVVCIIEPDAGNPEDGAELYADNYFDDMRGVNLHIRNVSADKAGIYKWTVSIAVNGQTYGEPVEFELKVLDSLPENLPIGATFPESVFYMAIGDELMLCYDDIQFTGGSVPEDVEVWREFWFDLEGNGEDWDDSVGNRHIRFDKEGRYQIEAVIGFNSFMRRTFINVIVGDANEDCYVYIRQRFNTYYADSPYDFVADFWVENAQLFDNDDVTWEVTRVSADDSDNPVTLSMDEWDDRTGGTLNMENLDGAHVGDVTWRIDFSAANGIYHASEEFTIHIVESVPSDAPNGISISQSSYNIGVGYKLALPYSDINFKSGTASEGDDVWKAYWIEDRGRECEYDDDDENQYITFNEEGRYQIYAEIGFGSSTYSTPISVIVGDGVNQNYELKQYVSSDAIYVEAAEYNYVGDVYMECADLLAGDDIPRWSIIPDEGNGDNPAELYIEGEFDNCLGVYLCIRNIDPDKLGTLSWTVSVDALNGLYTGSKTVTVNISNLNPDHPTDITLTNDRYTIGLNEVLELEYDDMQFSDGNVPEGADIHRQFWCDLRGGEEWDEEGFKYIRFVNPGRYIINATMIYNSFMLQKPIEVIVGDGPVMDLSEEAYIVYADAVHSNMIANISICNTDLISGEQVKWDVEPIGDHGGNPATLEIRSISDDNLYMELTMLYVDEFQLADELQWEVTYSITGTDITGSKICTVSIVNLPDNSPTGASFSQTEYHLNWGETLTLAYEDIQFTDGEVPDGMEVWRNFVFNIPCETFDDDGKLGILFHQEGTFRIDASIGYGSFCKTALIIVYVGSGQEPISLAQYQRINTLYMDRYEDNEFIGNVEI